MRETVFEVEQAAYRLNELLATVQLDMAADDSDMSKAYYQSLGMEAEGNIFERIRDAIVKAFRWLKEKVVNAYRSITGKLKKWSKRNDEIIETIKATEGDAPAEPTVSTEDDAKGGTPEDLAKNVDEAVKTAKRVVIEDIPTDSFDEFEKFMESDDSPTPQDVDKMLAQTGEVIKQSMSKNGMVAISKSEKETIYRVSKADGISPEINVIEKTDDKGMVSYVTEVKHSDHSTFKGEGKSALIKTAETLGTLIRALEKRITNHDDKNIQRLEDRAVALLKKMNDAADKGKLERATLTAMSSATQKVIRVMTDINVMKTHFDKAEVDVINKAQKALFALRKNLK